MPPPEKIAFSCTVHRKWYFFRIATVATMCPFSIPFEFIWCNAFLDTPWTCLFQTYLFSFPMVPELYHNLLVIVILRRQGWMGPWQGGFFRCWSSTLLCHWLSFWKVTKKTRSKIKSKRLRCVVTLFHSSLRMGIPKHIINHFFPTLEKHKQSSNTQCHLKMLNCLASSTAFKRDQVLL